MINGDAIAISMGWSKATGQVVGEHLSAVMSVISYGFQCWTALRRA
ncbi:hypothetical protein FBR4_2086 [Lactiplantibacillus plantarum]|jgi:hypothetical protein|nr:Hypothetical protein zj316_1792 [Lactiplantibacillus plantarum ZJ316]AGL64146.2 hypothetical protein LBP_cg1400 [Lactiplantibacillus plantarum subsp. plantarum P-8]EPD23588.1 Hypothetical protein L103_11935 [Lactiplantibacillus plantarum IPLA88]KZD93818.1 hypothetical protein FBR4_2086 [Lactiplantibacillus plantarum]KZT96325.1 hypothetical protein Nizo2258_2050 [Lactiplantibacillus plantarum]